MELAAVEPAAVELAAVALAAVALLADEASATAPAALEDLRHAGRPGPTAARRACWVSFHGAPVERLNR